MGQAKLRAQEGNAAPASVTGPDGTLEIDGFPEVPEGRIAIKFVEDGRTTMIDTVSAEAFVAGRLDIGSGAISVLSVQLRGDPRTSKEALRRMWHGAVHAARNAKKNEKKRYASMTSVLWCVGQMVEGAGVHARLAELVAKNGRAALTFSATGAAQPEGGTAVVHASEGF